MSIVNVNENLTPVERQRLRALIVALLIDHPDGLTCDEIEVMLGMSHQTASARLCELKEPSRGYVETTDRKRMTRSKRLAYVNVLTTQARKRLEEP